MVYRDPTGEISSAFVALTRPVQNFTADKQELLGRFCQLIRPFLSDNAEKDTGQSRESFRSQEPVILWPVLLKRAKGSGGDGSQSLGGHFTPNIFKGERDGGGEQQGYSPAPGGVHWGIRLVPRSPWYLSFWSPARVTSLTGLRDVVNLFSMPAK